MILFAKKRRAVWKIPVELRTIEFYCSVREYLIRCNYGVYNTMIDRQTEDGYTPQVDAFISYLVLNLFETFERLQETIKLLLVTQLLLTILRYSRLHKVYDTFFFTSLRTREADETANLPARACALSRLGAVKFFKTECAKIIYQQKFKYHCIIH